MHNSTAVVEINTIQTVRKPMASLSVSGVVCRTAVLRAPVVPLDGHTANESPRRITRPGFLALSVLCIYTDGGKRVSEF